MTDQPNPPPQIPTPSKMTIKSLPKMATPQMDHIEAQLKEMAQIASERLRIQLQREELDRTEQMLEGRQKALFYILQGVEQGRKLETEHIKAVQFEEDAKKARALEQHDQTLTVNAPKPDEPSLMPEKPLTRQDLVISEPKPTQPEPPPPPPPAR